ncbi:hypothetical protein LSTR_LSTR005699 [Laodelphax striatellus]|uniref:Uncharacterized protein n=1 Tax=Laodelphax striatellus TaxID=195883 RepID=A0A482XP85_LAOST|nr:hypothetical protein LSTR_LSTR005699 [Laodelphax striatellus]
MMRTNTGNGKITACRVCYQVPWAYANGVDALFSFFRRQPDAPRSATGLIVDCGYHCTQRACHKLVGDVWNELLHEHCYLAGGASRDYGLEVWQWADCDYYEARVLRLQLPNYQQSAAALAAAAQGGDAAADQQRHRRQELKRRLLEINARKREEKLAEDEEYLNQLLSIQDVEEEGDEQELERSLAWFNLQNTDELRKAIKDVQQRIEKTRQRIVAANTTADDAAIEALNVDLISQLAGGGGGSGSGEGGGGKRAKDDDFGARDEDWDVYKAINKEGGDTDSEEETEKLLELEEALRLHDPLWQAGGGSGGGGGDGPPPTSKEAYQLHVATERLRAVEALFQPQMLGCGQAGLAETVQYVLNGYDAETAQRLADNVFVTGGCARIPGLEARLTNELLEMRPFKSHFKVVTEAGDEASLGAWRGARKFATQGDFRTKLMTTRQDYAERGADYFREHRASNVYVPTPQANQVTATSDATCAQEMVAVD